MLDLVTRMTAVEAEEAIRKDPKLTCLAKLPTEDLRSFCEIAVQSISIWDAGEDLPASAHCFHQLGRFGEHHGIPVTDIVWALKRPGGTARGCRDSYGRCPLLHHSRL